MKRAFRKPRAKADENQKGIVEDLRKVGAGVISLVKVGDGVPDLLVYFRGEFFLLEVKNPATDYGRRGANANQRVWIRRWNGAPVYVVYNSVEAYAAIGLTARAA